MEAKLIGYDETPIDVTAPDIIGFENLKDQEPSSSSSNSDVHSISEASSSYSCVKRVGQSPASRGAVKMDSHDSCNNHSSDADSKTRGTVVASSTK